MPDAFCLPQELNGWICNLNINGSNLSYGKKYKIQPCSMTAFVQHSQLKKNMNLHYIKNDVFRTIHVDTGQALKCMNTVHLSCQSYKH